MSDELKEQLAAIEHQRWAQWQQWMHNQCTPMAGGLLIPPELVERWQRQIATAYADLSEAEKESDREQVERYWPLIQAELERLRAELDRLADAILAIPGEPASEGGAVDVAIRIMQEARSRYASSGAWAEAERLRAELAKAQRDFDAAIAQRNIEMRGNQRLLPIVEAANGYAAAWAASTVRPHLSDEDTQAKGQQLATARNRLLAAVDASTAAEQPSGERSVEKLTQTDTAGQGEAGEHQRLFEGCQLACSAEDCWCRREADRATATYDQAIAEQGAAGDESSNVAASAGSSNKTGASLEATAIEYRDPNSWVNDKGEDICYRCGKQVLTFKDGGWACDCDSAMHEHARPAEDTGTVAEGGGETRVAPTNSQKWEQVEQAAWYQRRVRALESLLAYYRVGKSPSEKLHRELESTSQRIDHDGFWRTAASRAGQAGEEADHG